MMFHLSSYQLTKKSDYSILYEYRNISAIAHIFPYLAYIRKFTDHESPVLLNILQTMKVSYY